MKRSYLYLAGLLIIIILVLGIFYSSFQSMFLTENQAKTLIQNRLNEASQGSMVSIEKVTFIHKEGNMAKISYTGSVTNSVIVNGTADLIFANGSWVVENNTFDIGFK